MAFSVPDLPYAYDALEPTIDEQTMHLHHDKHHQAYVTQVNNALEGTDLADKPIEEVLKNLNDVPEDKRTPVRNNGGGHYNHSLFWEWMSPDGGGVRIPGLHYPPGRWFPATGLKKKKILFVFIKTTPL